MTDFARARMHMIDSQLRTSGITDKRILARMGAIERERFVPAARRVTAYTDGVQWLGPKGTGRFIAPPAIFAKLLQLAEIKAEDHVLDLGAGSGYSTAVIAGLAASVAGYEPDAELAATAAQNLAELGLANATMVPQLGKSLYDVVLVEGMVSAVPEQYFATLKEGGRLIAPVWSGGVSIAHIFVRTGNSVSARTEFNVAVPPLLTMPAPEFVF
jgi:protein-L-isoaspartate(D-aspartate) O-methyltransferase